MRDRKDAVRSLRGAMTALVTPFHDGEIDWPVFDALIDRQVEGGTDWLVPCGTTGESPTLSSAEQERLLDVTVKRAGGRCGVLAGTGTNCTAETIRRTRRAEAQGADAAMLVTPYYNRPTQEGMYRHFAAVAESAGIPLVLYNVPARTAVTLSNETIIRLRKQFPHIVAVKDATGNIFALSDLLARSDIAVLCGDDALTWPWMALGAVGVISVLSNLDPMLMKSLVLAAQSGDTAEARRMHHTVCDLTESIAVAGPNPVPIKTAMAMKGLLRETFRLPLCPAEPGARAVVEKVMQRHHLAELVTA